MTWDMETIVNVIPWALALLLLGEILRRLTHCLGFIIAHIKRIDRRIDALERSREENWR